MFTDHHSLQLAGEVANFVIFLKYITGELTSFELEDQFNMTGWQDLLVLIHEWFSQMLLSLRIGAASASQFMELIQAIIHHEVDPPELTLFFNEDLCYIVKAHPNIKTLWLCPIVTVWNPDLLFSIIHFTPLVTDSPLTFTLAISFFTDVYQYTIQ